MIRWFIPVISFFIGASFGMMTMCLMVVSGRTEVTEKAEAVQASVLKQLQDMKGSLTHESKQGKEKAHGGKETR